ncbi:alpha/beta fold hydrolase [Novosphingobium sp. ERW19]|uniref:alpha/beta fold hydrolase n=1 Tax=Novosphingobium sp. ERW19 TaxID=2726186 RepID=UPI001456C9CC|nr:alpha/beta fold hydrolase [Novosphingobium sp. ERW19]NLR40423.1 alpha/beta hydrolase [Novosphingobium sp. ERW19]
MPTYPSITRAYTRCRHGQMHYRVAGPADAAKVPVLLLHQNPSSGYEYEALIDALASDRRVFAFDTPGYGMSDAPPSPPGMAGYAADFSDALDALEVDGLLAGPIDLYGFHTGTLLCSELAIARPDRVRRLVLTGIPMFPADVSAKKLDEALNYPAPEESGESTLTLLRNLWNYVVTSRDPAVPLQKAVFNFADKARVLDRFTWAYQGVWSWDYSRLGLVAQPALLLQPAEDLLEMSKAAAALMPHCSIVEMLDLDRDIFDVAPERIANDLRSFFDHA